MKRQLILFCSICLIGALFFTGCISEKKLEEPKPAPTRQPAVSTEITASINLEDEKFIYSPEGENPFDPIITTVIKINIDK
ncbi:MAG TPA: hypothetical protein ENN73_01690, partial [Firmicutes bacterium]|nr:hypothetical protein [Bacillota bacterium]